MVFVIKGLPLYISLKRQSWKKNYELRLPPNPERPEDLPPPWDAWPPILAILVRSDLLIAANPLLEFPEFEFEPPLPEPEPEFEDLPPPCEA